MSDSRGFQRLAEHRSLDVLNLCLPATKHEETSEKRQNNSHQIPTRRRPSCFIIQKSAATLMELMFLAPLILALLLRAENQSSMVDHKQGVLHSIRIRVTLACLPVFCGKTQVAAQSESHCNDGPAGRPLSDNFMPQVVDDGATHDPSAKITKAPSNARMNTSRACSPKSVAF
ncbi:hypothetical protein B0H66DRAFT_547813 [Apodospora peruviana]|uniref:Uncharacterized protein n=1 Tax=Apodospora peruviana TaxID=516989 RepID=A0AAE0IHS1_9PEZI|nr:hypothetical protein B0H66DRAFT_547813 [Apodospora peruviana]